MVAFVHDIADAVEVEDAAEAEEDRGDGEQVGELVQPLLLYPLFSTPYFILKLQKSGFSNWPPQNLAKSRINTLYIPLIVRHFELKL